MHVAYAYDPEVHHHVDLPVARYLRKELNLPNLVTWWFEDEREIPGTTKVETFKTWVVSLFDGYQMLDIGHLGSGKGESPECTRENCEAIVIRMRSLISKAEAKTRMKLKQSADRRAHNDKLGKRHEAFMCIFGDIKKKRGVLKAVQWLRLAAPELVDGGMWSFSNAGVT